MRERAARRATVAGALLALLGFWLVWHYGHRGVMILDHSIVFDGGYRVYLGQVYYKDFYAAYMPGALWVQAWAFHLFGVNFTAMVVPAAVLNAIGVGLAMRVVWVLTPGFWVPPAVAGVLTAFWFQAPYGAVMHEQLSFFACLAGLWAAVEATAGGLRERSGWGYLLAGVAVAWAVLCKQNAGGLAGVLIGAVVVTGAMPAWGVMARRLGWMAAGVAAGLAPFLVWVRFVSDWDRFVTHAILTPLSLGGDRAPRTASKVIRMLSTWDWTAFPVAAVSGAVWLVAALGLAFAARRREDVGLRLAGVLGPGLIVYMSIFRRTALNEEENCLPFIGLALGLAVGVLFYLLWGRDVTIRAGGEETHLERRTVERAIAIPVAMLTAGLLLYGYQTVRVRRVHDFDAATVFAEPMTVPGMERVVWGSPTKSGKVTVSREEFEGLYRYLAGRGGNFLVHNDATILYGLLGRRPPQPLLFVLTGHTFRKVDVDKMDGEILEALRRNDVRTVVIEDSPYMEETPRLEIFPRTGAWVHSGFRMVGRIGMYQLWERIG